jgi:hypothetical protein
MNNHLLRYHPTQLDVHNIRVTVLVFIASIRVQETNDSSNLPPSCVSKQLADDPLIRRLRMNTKKRTNIKRIH